ncbi:MAG: hypothetical protein NWQ13_09530 [Glaciimonas sp.]|nr:hypothetical protein [Glaciimonas sp.]
MDEAVESPKSEIRVDGIATGKIVSGAYLEAAVRWNDFYLLFMTDDCPFEESLNIHLLDKNADLVDSATMFSMYSTGSFSSLKLMEPNTLHYNFFGDIVWRLELLTTPVFSWPFLGNPRGVWRKFKFKCHFKIYGRPLPEIYKRE